MKDSLDGLAEFVAVADAGGFTAAARRLGVAKSMLSDRVARLEDRLGVRLLHRTTRRLGLTEAGHVFHERGLRILEQAAMAEGALQELRGEPRGQLRVTASVQFAIAHLAPALPAFRDRYPHVSVDVLADDAVRDLNAEGVDVAIRFAGPDEAAAAGRHLAPIRYVLCAAPAYLERRGAPRRPEDLRGHDCLLYRASPAWNEWAFRAPSGGGGAAVRVRAGGPLCSDSALVLRAAAVAGGGIAELSTLNAGEELRAGRLARVLPDWPLAGRDGRALWAVHPGTRPAQPKVRAFVDFLSEHIGDPPYWDAGL